jgi:hypothetical protein
LRNYSSRTRNIVQREISNIIFAADREFWCFGSCPHPLASIPGFLSQHSFLCWLLEIYGMKVINKNITWEM